MGALVFWTRLLLLARMPSCPTGETHAGRGIWLVPDVATILLGQANGGTFPYNHCDCMVDHWDPVPRASNGIGRVLGDQILG